MAIVLSLTEMQARIIKARKTLEHGSAQFAVVHDKYLQSQTEGSSTDTQLAIDLWLETEDIATMMDNALADLEGMNWVYQAVFSVANGPGADLTNPGLTSFGLDVDNGASGADITVNHDSLWPSADYEALSTALLANDIIEVAGCGDSLNNGLHKIASFPDAQTIRTTAVMAGGDTDPDTGVSIKLVHSSATTR